MQYLLELAKKAALDASYEILKHYEDFKIYTKEDNSPLTSADLAANEIILETLKPTGIKICSEESILSQDERVNADMFWLIDPLDGTKEFIAKSDEFCICIALIKDGRPILSVIAIPCLKEIFYSSGNGTIYKNHKVLNLDTTPPKILLMGRHSKSQKGESLAQNFDLNVKHIGSAIKFCRIAENSALVYTRIGPSSIWDIAAGDFLVEQSGGVTIDLKTMQKPLYNAPTLINNPYLVVNKNTLSKLDEMLEFLNSSIIF
ncbi:MAG: 3'(2'),5'-bisphosphate nucleotidase CysQ [Campylobacter sp.]|nr:3'(2'),5'-bisphosphate nucleotidase CysQ [Campylobacter sp.]